MIEKSRAAQGKVDVSILWKPTREQIAAAGGKVIHIHPEVSIPSEDFNFTAVSIETAMRDACEKTKAHLATNPRK